MMVKKMHSSRELTTEEKEAAFARMKELDDSDKLGLSAKYCEAVLPTPEAKKKIWDILFGAEVDKLSLYQVQEYVAGFRQFGQMELLSEYAEPFFQNILQIVNTKAKSVSEPIFYGLRPNMKAS